MNANENEAEIKAAYSFLSPHFFFRCITKQDTDTIVMWRSDPEIIRYFRSSIPVTRESHLKWYREKYLKNPNRYDFIAWDVEEPVGFVALIRENERSKTAEINYTIGNSHYRGFHYGSELISGIVRFGYDTFGITQFIAQVHRDNVPSQKAALTSGFCLKDNSSDFWTYVRSVPS